MKWLVWRVVELLLRLQFQLWGPLAPDEKIERDVYYTGQIYPRDTYFRAVRAGKVKPVKGVQVKALTEAGVVTTGGEELPAQLLVWATGHAKAYGWADAWTRQRLDLRADGLHLYRNIVAPEVGENLLFVGSEARRPYAYACLAAWEAPGAAAAAPCA